MTRYHFPCTRCGQALWLPIDGNMVATMVGCSIGCPCGGFAIIPDGAYTFVNQLWDALSPANDNELHRLRLVIDQASAGDLTSAEAAAAAGAIRPEFGALVKRALDWGIPALLVSAIALVLQIQSAHEQDQANAATFAASLRQAAAAERQATAAENLARNSNRIAEALERLDRLERPRPAPHTPPPRAPSTKPYPSAEFDPDWRPRAAFVNRKARMKAVAEARAARRRAAKPPRP